MKRVSSPDIKDEEFHYHGDEHLALDGLPTTCFRDIHWWTDYYHANGVQAPWYESDLESDEEDELELFTDHWMLENRRSVRRRLQSKLLISPWEERALIRKNMDMFDTDIKERRYALAEKRFYYRKPATT